MAAPAAGGGWFGGIYNAAAQLAQAAGNAGAAVVQAVAPAVLPAIGLAPVAAHGPAPAAPAAPAPPAIHPYIPNKTYSLLPIGTDTFDFYKESNYIPVPGYMAGKQFFNDRSSAQKYIDDGLAPGEMVQEVTLYQSTLDPTSILTIQQVYDAYAHEVVGSNDISWGFWVLLVIILVFFWIMYNMYTSTTSSSTS